MNFLETIICLSLLALSVALGVFAYQPLLIRTQVHRDTQLVKTALYQARQHAPSSVHCHDTACNIHSKLGEYTIIMSGKNSITTHLFPANAKEVLVFTQEGATDFHNGTITISSQQQPEILKKVVISQGGRIRT